MLKINNEMQSLMNKPRPQLYQLLTVQKKILTICIENELTKVQTSHHKT